MDKTTKFILGLIAVSLIGINIQMWNGKTGLIKDARAYDAHSHDKYEIYGLGTILDKSDVEDIIEDCGVYISGDYGSISC